MFVLGVLSSILILPSTVVVSPEFNVVLVQGSAARWGLLVLLLGIPLAAAFSLHAFRTLFDYPNRLRWWSIAGLGVGIWAVRSVTLLNVESEVRVYSYLFLSPPFVVWMVFCCLEIGFIFLRLRSALVRGLVGTVLGATVGSWIVQHLSEPTDPWIITFWEKASWFVLPVSAAWLAWSLTWITRRRTVVFTQATRARVLLTSSAGVAAAIATVLLAMKLGGAIPARWAFLALLLWFCSVLVAVISELLSSYKKYKDKLPSLLNWGTILSQGSGPLLVLCHMFFLADMFFFGRFRPLTDLLLIFIIWFFLVEVIAGRPLSSVLKHPSLDHIWSAKSPARAIAKGIYKQIEKAGTHLRNLLRGIFSANSKSGAILKTLAGVAILIFLAELPDAGKLVIKPLNDKSLAGGCEAAGGEKGKDCAKDLGRSVSEQVANTIGLLGRELQPEVTVLVGTRDRKVIILNAASGGLEAEVKQELKIGDTTIPLGFLQTPARWLFGIQVISGSIQPRGSGLILLAASSIGGSWEAHASYGASGTGTEAVSQGNKEAQGDSSRQSKRAAAKGRAPRNEVQQLSKKPGEPGDDEGCRGPESSCLAAHLAEELAYKILVSQPSLVKMGMTSSWQALRHFRNGLAAWHQVENSPEDYDDRITAIREFREAIKIDPKFALAYYKLGHALNKDYQPASAIEAFRSSVEVNPDFVAGRLALAQTLYDFGNYKLQLPALIAESELFEPSYSQEMNVRQQDEARRYWESVVALPDVRKNSTDQGVAYYGLCRYYFLKRNRTPHDRYLAYYYCRRADAIYDMLPAQLTSDPDTKSLQAAIFNMLGVVIDDTTETNEVSGNWQCNAEAIVRVDIPTEGVGLTPVPMHHPRRPGPNTRHALGYYSRALQLTPEDDILRCNVAATAEALDNTAPMEQLRQDASMHELLGEALLGRAKELTTIESAPAFYRAALAEFEQAVELSPSSPDAMNNYGYGFWEWRLRWFDKKPPDGPEPAIAHRAEELARNGLHLVQGKISLAKEAIFEDTLGEVLLGEGRPEEALVVLQDAYHKSPKHAFYNEVRWDLAKAYVCVTDNDRLSKLPAGEAHDFWTEATGFFNEIRTLESSREMRPFTKISASLDPARLLQPCSWRMGFMIEREPKEGGRFLLARSAPIYGHEAPCNSSGVWADVLDSNKKLAEGRFVLHFWGGGIDERVSTGSPTGADDIPLAPRPPNTHFYYLAQLENEDQEPLSSIYYIKTFKEDGKSCRRNGIHLQFIRQPERNKAKIQVVASK
jgi:tetratricopeptide (TPR) repeat protein